MKKWNDPILPPSPSEPLQNLINELEKLQQTLTTVSSEGSDSFAEDTSLGNLESIGTGSENATGTHIQ